jgi:hypothetical protein
MREMLVFRIINREDDHFDRFKIQIEFFVWFFLKFIENDHFLWMKNTVNRKWWMRKWIVKTMKMKCKKILDLKKDFLFLFLIKLFFRFVFQFCYSFCRFFLFTLKNLFLKLSWCHLCEIFFRLISTLSSLIDRCRNFSRLSLKRTRNRSVVKNVSSFWSRILFSNAFSTWIVSFVIVVNVLMLFAWL